MFKYYTLFLLLATALANPLPPSPIASCLTDHGLNVETSQDAPTPFNNRYIGITPAAIVYPAQTSDVAKAVQCAVQHDVRVSAVSGGHSYSASGYGSQDGHLVIIFRDMAQVLNYNSDDGVVTVQPGARLGDFALELYDKYHRAMAHGICPYVGLGGHAGFGGWGLSSRNWGLLIDQIVGADLVLANGTSTHVSRTQNADLFWAIRGASSSFGVITQFTMQTHQAPASVIRFAYNFINPSGQALDPETFASIMHAYQVWGLTAPKEIGIVANVWQEGKTIEMTGYYTGTQADFDRVIAPLLSGTGQPSTAYVQERDWIAALTEADGGSSLSTKGTVEPHDTFYAKSLVVPSSSPLTVDALKALVHRYASTPPPNNMTWFIQFELWGGGNSVISSVDAGATAYPHRQHHWTVQFYGRAATASWPSQGTAFMNGLVNAVTDNMQGTRFGAYANYLDPELLGWREKYYAGNYARLARIQEEMDPRGVFMKADNIGAPET
ncbi:glucooligosaccharide oxidase [Mycena belliarum]|uniref:Glucooligosaccharide oxidase n=1 Tax=Mycena belliarum TaxID=1033014 RepID=A0AAD6UK06_9AGAR|nr:glucooligosaccharide oxidase [Mycena belliae]